MLKSPGFVPFEANLTPFGANYASCDAVCETSANMTGDDAIASVEFQECTGRRLGAFLFKRLLTAVRESMGPRLVSLLSNNCLCLFV